jgi:hypothetical protein
VRPGDGTQGQRHAVALARPFGAHEHEPDMGWRREAGEGVLEQTLVPDLDDRGHECGGPAIADCLAQCCFDHRGRGLGPDAEARHYDEELGHAQEVACLGLLGLDQKPVDMPPPAAEAHAAIPDRAHEVQQVPAIAPEADGADDEDEGAVVGLPQGRRRVQRQPQQQRHVGGEQHAALAWVAAATAL